MKTKTRLLAEKFLVTILNFYGYFINVFPSPKSNAVYFCWIFDKTKLTIKRCFLIRSFFFLTTILDPVQEQST